MFYLPRLWVKLDKDLREELDTQQAVADSAVYSSLALFITGLLWLAYAPLGRVGWLHYTATSKLALAAGVSSITLIAAISTQRFTSSPAIHSASDCVRYRLVSM